MRGDTQCSWVVRETPIGPLFLAATGVGLVRVGFHAGERAVRAALAGLAAGLGVRPVPAGEPGSDPVLARAVAELEAYFAGGLKDFRLPLDWSLVSGFTGQVLRELAASVPFGSVVGYRELAVRVGDPDAASSGNTCPGKPC